MCFLVQWTSATARCYEVIREFVTLGSSVIPGTEVGLLPRFAIKSDHRLDLQFESTELNICAGVLKAALC